MTKKFCDGCGNEITAANRAEGGDVVSNQRLGTTINKGKFKLKIEIITGRDDGWNNADFCKHCIIDAVNELDDRPKAAHSA